MEGVYSFGIDRDASLCNILKPAMDHRADVRRIGSNPVIIEMFLISESLRRQR